MESGGRPHWRRWLPRILLYGALHYTIVVILDSVAFLLAHFPPKLLDLSPAVVGISYLDQALNVPRIFLRNLWPSESTPSWLTILLLVLNSLAFGALWYGWRRWRTA